MFRENSFCPSCAEVLCALLNCFQDKAQRECAVNLLKIKITFLSLRHTPYVFSLRQFLLSEDLVRSHWTRLELIREL